MRATSVAVLVLLLAMPIVQATGDPTPLESARALHDALVRGDAVAAQAAYAQGLHGGIAARDPALDANLTAALGSANATVRAPAIGDMIAVGALERGDEQPWRDVAAYQLNLSGPATDAPLFRAQATRALAIEVRQRMADALSLWDEPAKSAAQAEAAQVAFGPVAGAVEPVVGAPYAAQLADEVASFVEAVQSGDKGEATDASGVASSILSEFIAPPTTMDERLAKVVSAADLLGSEYDEYVKGGQVVDQDAYDHEVLGVFVPGLEQRWSAVEGDVAKGWPAQEAALDQAVDSLKEKVAAKAPNAEVAALVQTIHREAAEVTPSAGAPSGSSSYEADAAALHDAVARGLALAQAGDKAGALSALQAAYLDVYGPRLEPRVLATSPAMNRDIESILNQQLPDAVKRGASADELRALSDALDAKVQDAGALVSGASGSDPAAFLNAFLIMLREGFEAILVLGALATYLLRTGHKAKTPLLYAGAGVGVLATLALYVAVQLLVDSLPVSRDILEGATALLAVVVLFYVSYWLISKVEVGKWNRFIQGKMKGALASGNAYALAGVAFLAVFREGFETVLFYQGLYGSGGHGVAITAGVLVGVVALALVFLGFYRFGVKIPMRPFFIVTSALLYYLAFAFAGKGVHELQDAGVVTTTILGPLASVLALPVVSDAASFLGVFPTAETLLAQAALLVAIAGGLAWTLVWEPRRARAADA